MDKCYTCYTLLHLVIPAYTLLYLTLVLYELELFD